MLLEARKIGKHYGQHVAVKGIDLAFERGSFNAILGPNGAGKSTTIGMLTGLVKPSMGEIIYEKGIKIGVVFQESVLDAELTVLENLTIRAKQYKNLETSRVEVLVKELGLTSFKKQRYGSLSGGQKRRVDIARALLSKPDLLFLDEPTTGLDIQTRQAIWALLSTLQKSEGLTIILTTHYLDEADSADLIYIVDQGQVIAKGSAMTIKQAYAQKLLKVGFKHEEKYDILQENGLDFEAISQKEFLCHPDSDQDAIAFLANHAQDIAYFEYRPGTMDDAFMALTGRRVR